MTSTQAQIGDTLMGSQPLSPGSEQGGGSLVLQVLALPVRGSFSAARRRGFKGWANHQRSQQPGTFLTIKERNLNPVGQEAKSSASIGCVQKTDGGSCFSSPGYMSVYGE